MSCSPPRLGACASACVLLLLSCPLAALADAPPPLPVRQVVLLNSGVGYFEHRGVVEDNATVTLDFDQQDINDLLKSMVLQDEGGGRVSKVGYASRDPLPERLEALGVDLSGAPTMAELLQQFRGERVRLSEPQLEGVIVGLEVKAAADDGQREFLNLLTDEGLRSLPLESVSGVRLVSEPLNDELRRALELMAAGRRPAARSVTLQFSGQGPRHVRVGYVRQTPVWKTSYRLVLADGDQPALLQGWAIVENTGTMDWQDVRLTLVSGRPVSFQMDLYEPLYVQRPQVPLTVMGSPRPRLYDRDRTPPPLADAPRGMGGFGGGFGGAMGMAGMGGTGMGGMGGYMPGGEPQQIDPSQGVEAEAAAGEIGEFFQYEIAAPVSLARQRSALLPIVSQPIAADRLSVYTREVHATHPMRALRLHNKSQTHWTAGPVTVFEDGSYAGDARFADVRPDSQRLISYAVDQEVEVESHTAEPASRLTEAVIEAGGLVRHWTDERTIKYDVVHAGQPARSLLVEHPIPAGDWRAEEPAAQEQTRTHLRYTIDTVPGKTVRLVIVERRQRTTRDRLRDLLPAQAARLADNQQLPADVRAVLQRLVGVHEEVSSLTTRHSMLMAQSRLIESQQSRIRSNMANLDRTSDLYQRYVKSLDEQETKLEELRRQAEATSLSLSESRQLLEQLAPSGSPASGLPAEDPFQ